MCFIMADGGPGVMGAMLLVSVRKDPDLVCPTRTPGTPACRSASRGVWQGAGRGGGCGGVAVGGQQRLPLADAPLPDSRPPGAASSSPCTDCDFSPTGREREVRIIGEHLVLPGCAAEGEGLCPSTWRRADWGALLRAVPGRMALLRAGQTGG